MPSSVPPNRNDPSPRARRAGSPQTLAVDIGGTNIKASVLDKDGALVAERVRLPTPKPATPTAVIDDIAKLANQLPPFHRISAGFPGVIRSGIVKTAPNLGTDDWRNVHLIRELAARFNVPVRALNDAEVQGLGVVQGPGLECTITLGTGIGCALFRDRRLLLHLELGQHLHGAETYDQHIGDGARRTLGNETWNKRMRAFLPVVLSLTACDRLYIGGGNARHLAFALPETVTIVSNSAGVTGGVRLWERDCDSLFENEPDAQWPPISGNPL
jgi:polyphosphate glucokinase